MPRLLGAWTVRPRAHRPRVKATGWEWPAAGGRGYSRGTVGRGSGAVWLRCAWHAGLLPRVCLLIYYLFKYELAKRVTLHPPALAELHSYSLGGREMQIWSSSITRRHTGQRTPPGKPEHPTAPYTRAHSQHFQQTRWRCVASEIVRSKATACTLLLAPFVYKQACSEN